MESTQNSSSSAVARSRLSVISSHLFASSSAADSILQSSVVSAAQLPPTVTGGSLTIVDDRTGKKYQIQVSDHGTIKATDLKKVLLLYITSTVNFDKLNNLDKLILETVYF